MSSTAEFDRFADTYDADLNQALSVSGEDKTYFARARVQWLVRQLPTLGERPRAALDFGCGIGDTVVLLKDRFGLQQAVGLDVSSRSVELANTRNGSQSCIFRTFDQYSPAADLDLVYCNGVFHHIPVTERAMALRFIFDCLRSGGIFAFWENNPWNPGTRYVMSKCVFDRDAVTISPPEAIRMVREQGFQVVQKNFLFFFPRVLKMFRFIEPWMAVLPIGAQFLVLCRKP